MNALYGDKEMLKYTGDERFNGAGGVDKMLEDAFVRGGLPALKGEFFAQALARTNIGKIRGPGMSMIFERIIAFE